MLIFIYKSSFYQNYIIKKTVLSLVELLHIFAIKSVKAHKSRQNAINEIFAELLTTPN